MSALLPVLFFAALLAGTILSMSRQQRRHEKIRQVSRPPASNHLPCFRRDDFFSTAERSLYEILRRVAPNHTVFAKVRLADLVFVRRTIQAEDLNNINRKHIDFVLCDKDLTPVVAINFNESPQPRDQFVEEVLAAAALPVIHLGTRNRNAWDDIHRLIAPYLRIGTPII